jgi:hypothetical protein
VRIGFKLTVAQNSDVGRTFRLELGCQRWTALNPALHKCWMSRRTAPTSDQDIGTTRLVLRLGRATRVKGVVCAWSKREPVGRRQ